ncbi:hypothetical protein GGS20DRAFT_570612 [Poronia punctata]|nr:hypothetical protein GGS20DRAFT_570612 [Poronia punctata]
MEGAPDTRPPRPESPPGSVHSSLVPTASDRDNDTGTRGELPKHQEPWRPNEQRAYMLDWSTTEITHTPIINAEQFRVQLQQYAQENSRNSQRLFVLRGLPGEYLVPLKDELSIDSAFIQAHLGRRRYRPRKNRYDVAWAYYDYPELVMKLPKASGVDVKYKVTSDYVGEPPTLKFSATGDSLVVCRVSVWMCEKATVLFLDRPVWDTSGVQRGRYKVYTPRQYDAAGAVTVPGDEIPSFETLLYEGFQDCDVGREDLLDHLEELVIYQWGELFEFLKPNKSIEAAGAKTMFWETLNSLERNLAASCQRKTKYSSSIRKGFEDRVYTQAEIDERTKQWEALAARVGRRVRLLKDLEPDTKLPRGQSTEREVLNIEADSGMSKESLIAATDRPRVNHYKGHETSGSQRDAHQLSINRVTYLGGVLLPFSIVSGILAIEEPYGPGDAQFWIFWAVTLPLMLLTLSIIYADSIRDIEVWVEEAASGKSNSDSDSDSNSSAAENFTLPDNFVFPHGRTVAELITSDRDEERAERITVTFDEHPVLETVISPTQGRARRYTGSEEDRGEHRAEPDSDDDSDDAQEHSHGQDEYEWVRKVEKVDDSSEEGMMPDTMVEKRWPNKFMPMMGPSGKSDDGSDLKAKKWRKEKLGWLGACATIFQLYKLKKGVPPNHARRDDRRRRARPEPRRPRTA